LNISQTMGKILIIAGIFIALFGGAIYFGGRIGLGRLPGDIVYRRGNFSLYFPLVSSIIISIVMTLILNLIFRFRR